MFPLFGCYTINPFFSFGMGMNPCMGFLMNIATSTIRATASTTYTNSLFTNPFISNNNQKPTQKQFTTNNTQPVQTWENAGIFGSLTSFAYTNPQPIATYALAQAAPTTLDISASVASISNRIAENIANRLASMPTPTTATMPQISTLSSSSTSPNAALSSSVSEPQGKSELKPGLFKGRLAGQEALVSRLCHKYNVSPALVASIIGLESGWGTSNLAMHNNFGGYRAAGDLGKNAKGFGYFSTIEKGLEAMIRNLAGYTRYSDVNQVNFNNLDSIGRHYCEGGVWSGRVRAMYSSRVQNYLA